MRIKIIKAYSESPKYDILYSSLRSLFVSNGIEVGDNADCHVYMGDRISGMLETVSEKECPIVRIVYRSDLARNFAIDESIVDFSFIIRDLDINILNPYRNTTEEAGVPFIFGKTDGQSDEPESSDIYVNTGEFLHPDSALFKILRTMNRLTRYKISICSRNESLKAITNSNITVSDSTHSIEEYVKRSRIIIGSGYAILFALKHRKPFIVVGERGYGGIPKEVNILPFYRNFFQGSIGGRLDGALPENLVFEDIMNLMSHSIDFNPLIEEIEKNVSISFKRIIDIISSLSENYRTGTNPGSLQFNNDYTIIEGNGIFWLLNRFTRHIIARLDESHLNVIRHYLKEDINHKDCSSLPKEVIEDLVKNKVLIPKNQFNKLI